MALSYAPTTSPYMPYIQAYAQNKGTQSLGNAGYSNLGTANNNKLANVIPSMVKGGATPNALQPYVTPFKPYMANGANLGFSSPYALNPVDKEATQAILNQYIYPSLPANYRNLASNMRPEPISKINNSAAVAEIIKNLGFGPATRPLIGAINDPAPGTSGWGAGGTNEVSSPGNLYASPTLTGAGQWDPRGASGGGAWSANPEDAVTSYLSTLGGEKKNRALYF